MTTRKDQKSHDEMVKIVANVLISELYLDVKAHIPGYETPDLIYWESNQEGHIPDVTATLNGIKHIFEIETEDSISVIHTESQWKLFSANADQFGKVFHIVVPKDCKTDAETQAIEWGVQAQVIGI